MSYHVCQFGCSSKGTTEMVAAEYFYVRRGSFDANYVVLKEEMEQCAVIYNFASTKDTLFDCSLVLFV